MNHKNYLKTPSEDFPGWLEAALSVSLMIVMFGGVVLWWAIAAGRG